MCGRVMVVYMHMCQRYSEVIHDYTALHIYPQVMMVC